MTSREGHIVINTIKMCFYRSIQFKGTVTTFLSLIFSFTFFFFCSCFGLLLLSISSSYPLLVYFFFLQLFTSHCITIYNFLGLIPSLDGAALLCIDLCSLPLRSESIGDSFLHCRTIIYYYHYILTLSSVPNDCVQGKPFLTL